MESGKMFYNTEQWHANETFSLLVIFDKMGVVFYLYFSYLIKGKVLTIKKQEMFLELFNTMIPKKQKP